MWSSPAWEVLCRAVDGLTDLLGWLCVVVGPDPDPP